MTAATTIEWTDKTRNPVRGCSVISPGCVNCYAMKQAHRFSGPGQPYEGLTKQTKAGPQWTGIVRPVDDALLEPLSWRKPQRVFVNSMSDLFHDGVPETFIAMVFSVMASSHHTFQVLTKRPARMLSLLSRMRWRAAFGFVEFGGRRSVISRLAFFDEHDGTWEALDNTGRKDYPLTNFIAPNVWLGVSVEDQQRADERIPLLLETPAAVRFISAEPLLGPVDLTCQWDHPAMTAIEKLDWVIVGGESGPGARPFDLAWARSIVEQCKAAGVPVFVKQLGASAIDGKLSNVELVLGGKGRPRPANQPLDEQTATGIVGEFGGFDRRVNLRDRKGGDPAEWPEDLRVREFPEARA